MKTLTTLNFIAAAIFGVIMIPALAFANGPYGAPQVDPMGVQYVTDYKAAVSVMIDASHAVVDQSGAFIYVRLVNLSNNQSVSSSVRNIAPGVTVQGFRFEPLKPNTRYAYTAVVRYNGTTYQSDYGYFTTTNDSCGQSMVYGDSPETQVNLPANSHCLAGSNAAGTNVSGNLPSDAIGIDGSPVGAVGTNTTTTTTVSGNKKSTSDLTTSTSPTIGSIIGSWFGGSKAVADSNIVTKTSSSIRDAVLTGGYAEKNGVELSITNTQARVADGDTFTYQIRYLNGSNQTLKNAWIKVQLPDQYVFEKGADTIDYSEKDNIVTVYLGNLAPAKSGMVTFDARANGGASGTVDTQAVLGFTQGSLAATDHDNYTSGSQSVLGASVFGSGFFPQSFGGWLLVILLIGLVIIVARRYTAPAPAPQAPKAA